jgi:heme A synthase
MTQLVARLILAMLILPVTGAVFILLFVLLVVPSPGAPEAARIVALWSLVYLFVGAYWALLWRSSVRWTRSRTFATVLAVPASLLIGACVGSGVMIFLGQVPLPIAMLVGGGVVPICWVVATVLIWRESPRERMERLTRANRGVLVCPICGYNLTGLHEARCPECGSRFTLDQLLTAQPAREDVEQAE